MAISVDNIKKYISHGEVYVGCAVPPEGTSMFGYASSGVPSGGTHIGATQGETTFTYTPTIEGIEIEQSGVPVAPHIVSEELTITFTCLEPTVSRMQDAFGSGGVWGPTAGTGAGDVIRLGGLTDVTGQCVAVIAEQPNNKGKYVGAMIYNAISDGGVTRSFKRGEPAAVEFTLKSFPRTADLNRADGEQAGQYAQED